MITALQDFGSVVRGHTIRVNTVLAVRYQAYLAIAAQIASGIAGIKGLEVTPPAEGDVYKGNSASIPDNVRQKQFDEV